MQPHSTQLYLGLTHAFHRRSRADAGEHLTLSELPLNAHGKRVLVADGASLAFFLLGPRRRGSDRAPLVSAWHLGGEYRDLAGRTRCVRCAAPYGSNLPALGAERSTQRRRFVAGLRAAGVSLTCVFDPAPMTHPESMRKQATWAERLQKTTLAVGELASLAARGSCEANALDSTPPPELFLEQVKRSLTEAGADVVVSLAAEADDQLVNLVREGLAYAVMSNDSDFAAAEGCRFMPLEMLEARTLMSGEAGDASRARGWVFEPPAVAASLGLQGTAQLFQMACIVGQDATSELVDRFDVMTKLGVARVRDRSPVRQVAAWLLERAASRGASEASDALLDAEVPRLCALAPADAAAWGEAVRASRLLYLAPASGGAPLDAALAWLAPLPPAAREVAAAVVRDALPPWALAIAAHRRGWLPSMSYERPWGIEAGGGVAAAHRPLRARMYAILLPQAGPPVREHAWSGAFWGSGAAAVDVKPDAAGAAAAVATGDADAAAGHAWGRVRAILHPSTTRQPLPLSPAASDPAMALPSDEAFAALVLRYLFSLRLTSNAGVVRRLSAWQAAACVATVAAALTVHEAAVARGEGERYEPGPEVWEPPPWRCLELSTLLQTSLSHALAAADVAGPRGSRRKAPAPAQMFSGLELLRLYRLAEDDARVASAQAADARRWPPPWWAEALPAAAAERAARLAAAAMHGLPASVLDGAAPEAKESSALDELLRRFAAAGVAPPTRDDGGENEEAATAAFDFGGADTDVLLPAEAPRRDAAADTTLPVEEHLPALLAASAKHAVLCVDGETGCGKSTMVPLALLRAAGPRGLVIVTQPRRVAAASLARRVAHTIGEPLGESVGYAIGQERVASSRTRLLFVTTGWLLRLAASARAGGDAEFARATHVVLDEAHDRSLDADFLSLLIKRRLAALGAGRRCPKIVVMSATLQAGVFGAYFGSVASAAPVVHVGARRFPVREIYLDELTSALGVTRPSLLAAASAESSDSAAIISDSASSKRSRRAPRASRRLLDIVVQLAMHTARPGTTTLVFLPGSAEIEAAQLSLLAYGEGRAPIEVFPLHSLVPRELQAAALEPPSPGMARVLLSTDIAESSLTLPDVTVVFDACMRRGPAWSEEKQMQALNTTYASRASLAQRAGRAGRVQPGTVVRLISRAAAALLPAHDAPEMECVSLDGVVLRAKHLLTSEAERVQELLAGAVSPPAPQRVEASLVRLVEAGALSSERGQLTTLGAFAALLPQLPLTVARALLIGLSAGAGADAVVLAAALCLEATPFKQVLAMFAVTRTAFVEDTAAAMRVSAEADAGRFSEPITWCHIYYQYTTGSGVYPRAAWQRIRRQLGVRAMKAFATSVRGLARDVPRALAATGLKVPPRDLAAIARLGSANVSGAGGLRAFDPEAFAAEMELIDSDEEQAGEPLAAWSTPVEALRDPREMNEPLLRLLTVAACGPNVLLGKRRTPISGGLEAAMKQQGAVWSRCLALFPPAWLRERGAQHLEASLSAAFGPNVVDCVHELAPEEGERDAAEAEAEQRLAQPKLSRLAKKKLMKKDAEAWVVQFAADPPELDGASGALEPPLLTNSMPVAAKCLIALGGGRRLIPLPVPSVVTAEALVGEAPRVGDGPHSRDEAAGRALSGWDLPHPLSWKWMHGESTTKSKLPIVELSQPSALHGVSESPAAAASRLYDLGRRYAAAASIVVYEDAGMRARVITLLPTRGIDAELMLLALAPGHAPPRARVRSIAGEPPAIVALAFTAPEVDAPFASLAPYCLGAADLRVVNALRQAFSAAVLRGDAAALPAALARFMELGARVLTTPMSIGLTIADEAADVTAALLPATGSQGPWPPYDLRLLDGE